MRKLVDVHHAPGILALIAALAVPLAARAAEREDPVQPKHPGPQLINVAEHRAAAEPLPTLGSHLPRLSRRLPRLEGSLPRMREPLPRLDSALPRLASRLPRLAGPAVQRLRSTRISANIASPRSSAGIARSSQRHGR